MADTLIKIPYLVGDLTYTVDVIDPTDLSVLESAIALTKVSGVHQGTVTGAHSGKLAFLVKHGANQVEHFARVRYILDDAGPWIILPGLDSALDGVGDLPVDVSDDEHQSTGWMICYDEFDERENDVEITIAMISGDGTAGHSLDLQARTETSATVEGVVGWIQFTGLRRGATYSLVRGSTAQTDSFGSRSAGSSNTFTVPDAPSFAIVQILGQE